MLARAKPASATTSGSPGRPAWTTASWAVECAATGLRSMIYIRDSEHSARASARGAELPTEHPRLLRSPHGVAEAMLAVQAPGVFLEHRRTLRRVQHVGVGEHLLVDGDRLAVGPCPHSLPRGARSHVQDDLRRVDRRGMVQHGRGIPGTALQQVVQDGLVVGAALRDGLRALHRASRQLVAEPHAAIYWGSSGRHLRDHCPCSTMRVATRGS